MREPSIFRGIAVSLLRPVIGSNDEIDVVALNWVADVRNQIAAQPRSQGPLSTSRKYPGCGWSRVYV